MTAPARCGGCRAAAPPGARFCPSCGRPLEPAGAPAESRKIVTVLFADLVDSTVLAETLDPEALRAAMDGYYTACTDAIAAHGGVVEKFIGDAVMAVFGALRSNEDDALRAVWAACAIRDALGALNTRLASEYGLSIDVHCGVCTGPAVVSAAAGGGARVVGDVVHTAARLQSRAAAHEILVGAQTARLAGPRLRMDAVAPLQLKGKRETVAAWRVHEVLPDPPRADRLPLIGRTAELARLHGAFRAARRDRRCRLVTVAGAAGIGKSRLVREFVAAAQAEDALVARGGCESYGAGLTYRPIAEAVCALPGGWPRAAAALRADRDDAERVIAVLEAALGLGADADERYGDEDGDGTGGDEGAGGHQTSDGRLAAVPDEDAEARLRGGSVSDIAWAARRLVEALGRQQPLVLVLDDVHRAEPTLLDLIGEVARTAHDTSALILCAARPTGHADDEAAPPAREPRAQRGEDGGTAAEDGDVVTLGALTPAQTRELVELLAEHGAEVSAQSAALCDEAVLDRVAVECDGNPLFAELLMESADVLAVGADGGDIGIGIGPGVRDTGMRLPGVGADADARPGGAGAADGIPTAVRVLIEAWIDRLPVAERELLERAAAVGGPFTSEDVRALATDATVLARGDALGTALGGLLRSRTIEVCPSPPGAFRITRTLARDTLYASASKSRRARWHTLLADRLAQRLAERSAEHSAEHSAECRAGTTAPSPAASNLASCAERLEEELAHHLEAACRLYREVQPGHPLLPELTTRAARSLLAVGRRALRRRDLPAAVRLLERGRELLGPGAAEHAALAVRISDACVGLGEIEHAHAAIDRALLLNRDDPATARLCDIQRRTVRLRAGGPGGGDGADLDPEATGPATVGALDAFSQCRLHQLRGLREFARGRVGAAEAAMREALDCAQDLGDAYEQDRLLATVCELTQWSPTPAPEAVELCDRLARRFDADRALLVPVLLTRSRLLALAGRLDAARADLDRARTHAAEIKLALGDIAVRQVEALIDSLAGACASARALHIEVATRLDALGHETTAATHRLYAARELMRLGAPDAAAAEIGVIDVQRLETRGRLVHGMLRARLEAIPGHPASVRADEILALLDATDDPVLVGDVRFEVAQALSTTGARDRALVLADRALSSFTAKGAELPARAVRAWVAAVRGGAG